MSWLLDGHPLARVLVTRLRYLGDIVMATAVVSALKRGDPSLDIGFLCEEAHAPVLAGHPELARVHVLGVRRRGRDARARHGGSAVAHGTLTTALELRRAGYDAAVDLFFNPRSAWLLRLAGVRARLAGPAGSRRRFYTHACAPGTEEWPSDLADLAPGGLGEHLSRLGPLRHAETGLSFAAWFRREGRRATTSLAPRAPAFADPLRPLLLAPGATWPSKRWPVEHWGALAAGLAAGDGRPVRVLSPPGGAALAAAVAAGAASARVVPLPEMALPAVLDQLAGAAGLVTVDGGVMHAAVALRVPTLALFGPTDPNLWFPYEGTGPFRVLATRPACHPCDLHDCGAFICLPELEPAVVAEAARCLFADGGRH